MGCFLACFGSSKTKKRPRKPPPISSASALSPKVESSYSSVHHDLAPKQAQLDESVIVVPQSSAKKEEKLGAVIPKKVTFDDSNVRTHVSDSVDKAVEISSETKQSGDDEKVVVVNGVSMEEQRNSVSASENGGSTLSSLKSYPPNHRYHNCRESYNEDEFEPEEQIDVYDYDEDKDDDDDDSASMNREFTPGSFSSMESRTKSSTSGLPMRNLDDMLDDGRFAESVLKQKEDSKEGEQAVDASLSSWLVSSESTPANKAATGRGLEDIPSETKASSHGSNSVKSFSDRPILGALTLDELKQMIASSSPRRSPSHNVDDRPIIGTVGSHWSEETPSAQSGSVSSFKGIPNTTSKYREDKRVNWHSTPFETRLEQALKKGSAGVPF